MTKDDLAAWLTQIWDEEEAIARATEHADGGDQTLQWAVAGARRSRFDNGSYEDYMAVRCGDWDRILVARDAVHGGRLAAHIARQDPAAVLARIAAEKQVLALHDMAHDPCDAHDASFLSIPCDTVRLLASPYADRPGYREEWKP